MKIDSSQDSFYLLSLKENYLDELILNERDFINDFNSILIDYINYSQESIKKISLDNNQLSKYLLIRGVDTIHKVFSTLLFYTNNPNLVLYHCQRSSYFYIEFVSQIKQDDRTYLQLNSTDAVLYVFKKTIFEIDYQVKCNKIASESSKKKFKRIDLIIEIMKIILFKIIIDEKFNKDIALLLINYNSIISIILYGNKCLYDTNLQKIYSIIKILVTKIDDINVLMDRIIIFLKTINNTNIEFFDLIDETNIITGLL